MGKRSAEKRLTQAYKNGKIEFLITALNTSF